MTYRLGIFVAVCIAASVMGIAVSLKARADYEAMAPRVEATLERACVQTCPDCPPWCARVPGAYFPPKP